MPRPGIFTGTILSMARAFGETAPLILVGAVVGGFNVEYDSILGTLQGRYTALPTTVFDWARKPPDVQRERVRGDRGADRRDPAGQRPGDLSPQSIRAKVVVE